MRMRTVPQALPNVGYAALVDILIATMGIFIVVFTQLQLDDAPPLVPMPVDGVVICTGDEPVSLYFWQDGQETVSLVAVDALQAKIESTWSNGARLLIGMTEGCAYSSVTAEKLWLLETSIRQGVAQDSGSFLIEIAPLSGEKIGPSSQVDLLERWRAVMPQE